jgi:LemA protein
MVWVLVIVVALIVLLLLVVIALYNRLVRLRNRTENAWAQVDVQLRRRYDLIPNLVETVKGYASHERETFEEVTRARAAAQQAQGVEQQAQAENALTAAIGRLFAVAEAYPELRATENFQQLQAQLTDVEQNIAVARQSSPMTMRSRRCPPT